MNSKVTASYMAANNDTLWLNTTSHNGTWQINGNNLSLATPDRALGIKPVIKLKSGIALISGKGTSDDPYIIEEDKKELQVGSFVALGKDIWTVYDIDKNNVRLVLNKYMDTTYRFDLASNIYNVDNANSLASYLNTTYYNSLSYKKDLKKVKWYTGEYNNSYKDIYNSSINAYVGIYNAADLKFNNELTNYLLMNGNSQLSYLYGNELVLSKPAIYRNIRPTISISKKEIKSGKGTLEKPYILED